ncbi:MAG: hypothetical protein DDT26_00756 [Dehalococcoidia bacterium]|nr:hypothetical protein [Chloroflexota bacterium]
MAFNIHDMKSALIGGGARPSLFQVTLLNPVTAEADQILPFMVKASSLPGSQINQINVPYFGRIVKEAGVRTYEDWSITVINDEDFRVRRAIEEWSRRINTYQGNLRAFGTSAAQEHKSVADVIQYGKTGDELRRYKMYGIWPTVISPIELGWENGDAIEEFQVTFSVDYWTVEGETSG